MAGRPNAERERRLAAQAEREPLYQLAADLIGDADFLLVTAGAGLSADSGLPVYNDIANVPAYVAQDLTYNDLCQPYWIEEDPELFYGFWGDCFNRYRDATTNASYRVLKRWRQTRFCEGTRAFDLVHERLREKYTSPEAKAAAQDGLRPHVPSCGFFVYTSNVDGHFKRHFHATEVYEVHGNVESWQCSQPCSQDVWPAPGAAHRFEVDRETMRAPEALPGNHPHCLRCREPARPHVLMFGDSKWVPSSLREEAYVAWEAAVEQVLLENPDMTLVVLEIGCGTRVPSVRMEGETVVADINSRQRAREGYQSADRPQATLVRLNPSAEECVCELDEALCIRARGAPSLLRIDAMLRAQESS